MEFKDKDIYYYINKQSATYLSKQEFKNKKSKNTILLDLLNKLTPVYQESYLYHNDECNVIDNIEFFEAIIKNKDLVNSIINIFKNDENKINNLKTILCSKNIISSFSFNEESNRISKKYINSKFLLEELFTDEYKKEFLIVYNLILDEYDNNYSIINSNYELSTFSLKFVEKNCLNDDYIIRPDFILDIDDIYNKLKIYSITFNLLFLIMIKKDIIDIIDYKRFLIQIKDKLIRELDMTKDLSKNTHSIIKKDLSLNCFTFIISYILYINNKIYYIENFSNIFNKEILDSIYKLYPYLLYI